MFISKKVLVSLALLTGAILGSSLPGASSAWADWRQQGYYGNGGYQQSYNNGGGGGGILGQIFGGGNNYPPQYGYANQGYGQGYGYGHGNGNGYRGCGGGWNHGRYGRHHHRGGW